MRFDNRSRVSTYLSAWMPTGDEVVRIGVAGYFGGGVDTGTISGIDRFAFPSDTKSTLTATLSTVRSALAGMADCGVF